MTDSKASIPAMTAENTAREPLATLVARVTENGPAVAAMGEWPAHISLSGSLTARLPIEGQKSSGFDAGLAVSLGLIPQHAQKLTAGLHAAYTLARVAQVRSEIERQPDGTLQVKHADSPSCWWLAGCSICIEGDEVDENTFRQQLLDFQKLVDDPKARLQAATNTLQDMTRNFDTTRGYAFGTVDGAIQGAYIAGHNMAVLHHQSRGLYFIGTFLPTLGLETFTWDKATDEKGRTTSGPVHGSAQFVKCASEAEMVRAVKTAQKFLGSKPQARQNTP